MKNNKVQKVQRNFLWEHSHEGIVCLMCGKILVSYNRHDYKTCGCAQNSMIDGGQLDYVRWGGQDLNLLQEVIITPIFRTKTGKISKKKIKTFREAHNGYKTK